MKRPTLDNAYIDEMLEQNTIDIVVKQIRDHAHGLDIGDRRKFMEAYKHCITVWDFADSCTKGEIINFIRTALNKELLLAFMEITATKEMQW